MTELEIKQIAEKQRNYFYTVATLNPDFRIKELKRMKA